MPLFRPAAGAYLPCLPQAGRRAQRQINIVKVTHYRRVSCLALLSGFSYSGVLRWGWEHLNVVSADARRDAFLEFVN